MVLMQLGGFKAQEKKQLEEEAVKLQWMHCIDLGNGVITPGKWKRNPYIEQAFDRLDFSNKKILNIGTCNGL